MDYVPARLGPINRETAFVLDCFQVEEPILLDNVYAQVQDVAFDSAVSVNGSTSMREAFELMSQKGTKTISVIDAHQSLVGVVTLGDIADAYLVPRRAFGLRPVPIDNIAAALDGEVLSRCHRDFNGPVWSERVPDGWSLPQRCGLVIVSNAEDAENAIRSGVAVVVATGPLAFRESFETDTKAHEQYQGPCQGLTVEPNRGPQSEQNGVRRNVSERVVEMASKEGVTLIAVPYDTYETTRLISQSEPVSSVMTSHNVIAFDLDDTIDEVRETMLRYKYRNFPVLDESGRPVGMLAQRHILDYTGKNVILVDHNEKAQSVEGVEQARILEIIDHHRVSSVETDQPIIFINRPVGATATIVNSLVEERGVTPPKAMAGIMCAAILSDTLAFRSPTSTPEDVRAVERLAPLADIDVEEFSGFMLEAGTSLEGKTEEDILFGDLKEFRSGGFKVGVSQVNIYHQNLEPLKERLRPFMEKAVHQKEYDLLIMMLTDIVKEGTEMLLAGNRLDIAERAFGDTPRGGVLLLPGVISRKKQVIPRLIRAINAM
jgi:manganese-dependent inorganic pyrophosphatase